MNKNGTKNVTPSISAKVAIWHPVVDFMLVGGASIIGGIALIVWFTNNQEWVSTFDRFADNVRTRDISQFWLFWILALVINYPHVMASYRLLYRSKAQISKFRWSAIYVPIILLVLCSATLIALIAPADTTQSVRVQFEVMLNSNSGFSSYIFTSLSLINVVYLGWHYNLQGWRMTETFASMHGIQFSNHEQRLIKSGFLAMVFTHAVLFLAWSPLLQVTLFKTWLPMLTLGLPVVGGITFILGGLGFYGAYQRTGKWIPINAITPWVASFFWYYLVTQYHSIVGIAVVVYVAHALQYLSFSNRIERNLQLAKNQKTNLVKSVLLMLALIMCGYLVFIVPSFVASKNNWSLHLLFGVQLLIIAINIHHYFIDSDIWKSNNLEMRRTLFSHLGER
jgi:hypothetical protein